MTQTLQEFTVRPPAAKSGSTGNLRMLIGELEALAGRITGEEITEILARSHLHIDDVAAFVTPRPDIYSRRRVARTETYEVLVMTWLPGQSSGAHDHAGSVSAFKILRGTAHETTFVGAADSLVDPTGTRELHEGEVGLDASDVIHAVRNDFLRSETLVSIHVYSPPIPELRRYTMRSEGRAPADAVLRRRVPSAPVVAIVGGGFSGTMVAARLLRKTAQSGAPIHLVIVDRQTSIAEGAAYRTPDSRHLLNVPASGMSAWPDRPDDFLEWARHRDSSAGPYTFLQRQAYGEYLRATLFGAIEQAGMQTSIEIRREEADAIERGENGWRVRCRESQSIEADVVVLATGHRPPVDPLKQRWSGSRARYIEDPWSSLALSSIEADESVCLLGTGLTAIDVLQCLIRSARTAPVVALSRRGLLPAAHAPASLPPIDSLGWLGPLLRAGTGVTTRVLAHRIRGAVRAAESAGQDWRQVIDGLRPHISKIWTALPPQERNRFLRHARVFWEVARHRMAPAVAEEVSEAASAGIFSTAGARVLAARGALDGVTLTVRRRSESVPDVLEFDWVVNCTGPGSGQQLGLSSTIEGLIDAGYLEKDTLGLGVRSTPIGRALAGGRVIEDLFVIGSLRKADAWESTAVPELRLQAALAADAIVHRINGPDSPSVAKSRSHRPARPGLGGGNIMSNKLKPTHIEAILLLTALAAGTVDVVSFANLGGAFASAMTGNFALLAYYVAQGDSQSAMGSVIALSGFVVGCAVGVLQRRGRSQEQAISLLLSSETGLLLFFGIYALWTPHVLHGRANDLQIALLAIAMGLQAVIGQTISLTTIVFTTTLTKLVGTIAGSIADGDSSAFRDVKIQSAVILSYLFGALLSGALIVRKADGVALLPVIAVAFALAVHRRAGSGASQDIR
jgi:uncharacterized NAD(P)/FAD-binding protein YdhS/uncharacterized membrane protein YoaK (UPF0700 family)/predicted metal-dependent enzyme (double-stranded beta helix superfamily)